MAYTPPPSPSPSPSPPPPPLILQPFDEYCITRKELHKLLMEQQITKMELEKAREEKYRLQQQLLSKRSIFVK